MLVDLVRTVTPDGLRLEGALHPPQSPEDYPAADLAICLHGVGGNFYSSPLMEFLAETFASWGIAALRVNTRGHDGIYAAASQGAQRWQGAAFEVVDECRQDLRGWLQWAREQGYSRVLLVGHSLGGIKVLYGMAQEQFSEVVGLAAISPPRLSYSAFTAGSDRDRLFASIAAAERHLAEHRPDALFTATFPFPLFMTASGYLDKYGPRERYNYCQFLNRLQRPVLFTFGGLELESGSTAFSGVPEAIRALPNINAPLRIEVVSSADHGYTGCYASLATVLAGWLESWEEIR